MTNFLEETLDALKYFNKAEKDVIWVGNDTQKTTWEKFKEFANFKYSAAFGWNYICLDFIIVGKDWWLRRWEYDGSEGWEFITYPDMPINNNFDLKNLLAHSLDN